MKGIWFTMESAIACIIMGMFILAVTGGYAAAPQRASAAGTAQDVLKSLDDRGVLRGYAVTLDYAGLDSEIEIAGYGHAVNICSESGTCVGPEPNATDVWAGSYFIAGKSAYQPLEIKLYLWED